ncbi:MAG: LemA family protein [Burkholderiales bacterium]|nr:LemA family protein [Burkholderiales bacterium]
MAWKLHPPIGFPLRTKEWVVSLYVVFLLVGLIAVLVYGVMLYNELVTVKHNVTQAWSNIEVLLKQRHDELPKLVEVCKQYQRFEQETLQRVIEARAKVFDAQQRHSPAALGPAETSLRASLGNLFAVAEAYPELRANEQFLNLHSRISALESAISDRREFYNASVNINNVRIEQFPEVVVASMFDFPKRQPLRFAEREKSDVDVRALFAA